MGLSEVEGVGLSEVEGAGLSEVEGTGLSEVEGEGLSEVEETKAFGGTICYKCFDCSSSSYSRHEVLNDEYK